MAAENDKCIIIMGVQVERNRLTLVLSAVVVVVEFSEASFIYFPQWWLSLVHF